MLWESGSHDSSLNCLNLCPGISFLNWLGTTSVITGISAVLWSYTHTYLFLHLYFTDLINENIKMKVHPFLPKYFFWHFHKFKGIIFWQKSLRQNSADLLDLSKAWGWAFFCGESHKVLDIVLYILHYYFYIAVYLLIKLYFCEILNFFSFFYKNLTIFADSVWYNKFP